MFQASSAALTFWRAVSSVKGGTEAAAPRRAVRMHASSSATALDVLRVDALLRAGAARERELAVGQALEVLASSRRIAARARRRAARRGRARRARPARRAARAGRASRGRPRASRPARASGSRPARGSRRTRARAPTGPDRHAVGGVAVGAGCSSSSCVADPAAARHRQRLRLRQRQRPGALDVVLLVELAQLALRAPRLGAAARSAVDSPTPSGASGNA